MESAFGVEHGDISKKMDYGRKKEPSTGRKVTAHFAGPLHGAVAGKKGKKLRAAGNQFTGAQVGSVAGSVAGGLAGAATRKPAVATAGSLAGGLGGFTYGGQRALARNTRKGYLKKED